MTWRPDRWLTRSITCGDLRDQRSFGAKIARWSIRTAAATDIRATAAPPWRTFRALSTVVGQANCRTVSRPMPLAARFTLKDQGPAGRICSARVDDAD